MKRSLIVFIVACIGVFGVMFTLSFRQLKSNETGARIDFISGDCTVMNEPGLVRTWPIFQQLHRIDSTPQTLQLSGVDNDANLSRLSQLVVRSSDGSSFRFDNMTIQYRVDPSMVCQIVDEVGDQGNYRSWLLPKVRAILRDAFGQQSTLEVSDPTTYSAPTSTAATMLNSELNPHGIIITQVDPPRPEFNLAYETAIEERNTAENEQVVIHSSVERAVAQRSRALAEIDQARNAIFQQRKAQREGELARATANQQERITEANAAFTRELGTAQAILASAQARAPELEAQWTAQVQETRAQVDALASNGDEAVMRVLAQQLEGVDIVIQPYQADPTPETYNINGVSR